MSLKTKEFNALFYSQHYIRKVEAGEREPQQRTTRSANK